MSFSTGLLIITVNFDIQVKVAVGVCDDMYV